MSVTLKLNDRDAAFIARVLKDVAKLGPGEQETVRAVKSIGEEVKSFGANNVVALAGAFAVSVRANQK